jgi:hypothetical protein
VRQFWRGTGCRRGSGDRLVDLHGLTIALLAQRPQLL